MFLELGLCLWWNECGDARVSVRLYFCVYPISKQYRDIVHQNHFYNELAWCLQLPTGETGICPVAAVRRSRKEDLIAKPANHYLLESVCALCLHGSILLIHSLPLNMGPQYSAQFICLNRAAKVVLA